MSATEKKAPDYSHPASELFDEVSKIDAEIAAIGPGTRDGFQSVYLEDALDVVARVEQQVDLLLDAQVAEARAAACNGDLNAGAFIGAGDLYVAHQFLDRVKQALEQPAAPGYPELVSSVGRGS